MAKVFTTEFSFHDMIYAALVSVHKKGQDVLLQVHLYDPTLYKYIRGGQLVFSGAGTLLKPHALEHAHTQQLVDCIRDALSVHFKKVNQ